MGNGKKKIREQKKQMQVEAERFYFFIGLPVFCVFSSHSLKECTNHKQTGGNICFICRCYLRKHTTTSTNFAFSRRHQSSPTAMRVIISPKQKSEHKRETREATHR